MKIINLKTYPQNGEHQECLIGLPFKITKGEDSFFYDESGVEKNYNPITTPKVDDRWIVSLDSTANNSLRNIFQAKVHKDLDIIVKYCAKMYKKSLEMELKKVLKYLK